MGTTEVIISIVNELFPVDSESMNDTLKLLQNLRILKADNPDFTKQIEALAKLKDSQPDEFCEILQFLIIDN